MNEEILKNVSNPKELEKLYRSDIEGFILSFNSVYPEISNQPLAQFWKTRLEFEISVETPAAIGKYEILFLVLTCLLTGFLIKIPQLFDFKQNTEIFYQRNAGLILFFGLSLYAFLTKKVFTISQKIFISLSFLITTVYANLLPVDSESHSILLASVHLPVLFWCIYGLVFIDFDFKNLVKRMDYVKYCADLAILGVLLLLAGGILTGITLGLFSAIGINIEQFYFDYIVVLGLVSAPLVATYIVKYYPTITNKIAPIIASIFSPLLLFTLVVYLLSILVTGKNPYQDREFLIVFNVMLLGVVALIIFSVSETSQNKPQKFGEWVLFLLCLIAIAIGFIAFTAILYRVIEFGLSPNRTVVLVSNVLILWNLMLIFIDLKNVTFQKKPLKIVEHRFASYLPVYMIWAGIVVFFWPLVFGMS